jgi:CheY-like chemotaxis protein
VVPGSTSKDTWSTAGARPLPQHLARSSGVSTFFGLNSGPGGVDSGQGPAYVSTVPDRRPLGVDMAQAPLTVLVVEDDSEVRDVIGEYLTLQGFTVLEAATGLEALLQVKHARPDAVVLDLNMPRLGGVEALRRIRAFDPSAAIIAVAEPADQEVHWQALDLGARDVLPAPVVLDDLLSSLEGLERAGACPKDPVAVPEPYLVPEPAAGHILVIDEDPEVRATLEEFLTSSGHRTVAVADEAAALEALVQEPPDLVLVDLTSPGLSGLEALPAVRALAPHAVVIVVGEVGGAEVARRALARGAFDCVVKPVDLAYLAESVDAALTMRRLTR